MAEERTGAASPARVPRRVGITERVEVMRHRSGEGEGRAVTAYAPGSVGNLSCGFDVLGLALEGPGDEVTAWPLPRPGVELRHVSGDGGSLPRRPEANAAGVAARTLLERAGVGDRGVALELYKGLPLCGGMGGSAASAAAAVRAVDAAMDLRSDRQELLEAALEGERVAAGAAHPDNVAPSLLGGLVLARPGARRPVVPLPVPDGLSVAVLQQEARFETRSAREALGTSVPLSEAVQQWGNTAALVAALFTGDWELLGDAVVDRLAEPRRAAGIPAFRTMRGRALASGAVAYGISGAGPAVFALCRTVAEAREAGEAMVAALREEADVEGRVHVSRAPAPGARLVDEGRENGERREDVGPWP